MFMLVSEALLIDMTDFYFKMMPAGSLSPTNLDVR